MNINLIIGIVIIILLYYYIGLNSNASIVPTSQAGGMAGAKNSIDVINSILFSS